ncbi:MULTISPECIES: DUF805 domain-containing protein [unclassified Streptomyces]|uniref:DUF805 domain-containing protein n=1 Tax=unclassified Streptomyces TaxID=2593676 RepID=UPI003251F077
MSWFIEALKKYAVFSGRARRKEYWMFALFTAIIYAVLIGIGFAIKAPVIALVFYVAILLPSLAVGVRRLHDTGRSGWWLLFGLVPLAGPITLLVFTCSDSQPGVNQYGPNPKEAAPVYA